MSWITKGDVRDAKGTVPFGKRLERTLTQCLYVEGSACAASDGL